MTKKTKERVTQAQMVIVIVHKTPECVLQDICDVLDLPSSSAGNHLRRLYAAGKLRRWHNGVQYVYRVTAGVDIPDVKLPEPAIRATPEKTQKVKDAIVQARQLEERGSTAGRLRLTLPFWEWPVTPAKCGTSPASVAAVSAMLRGADHG
jgi:hypothetical protein